MKSSKSKVGFTTGSAAAAAAKAGILCLAGYSRQQVEIPLPNGKRLTIELANAERIGSGVRTTVIKDAGDDPDVTHKAWIVVTVNLKEKKKSTVSLKAGHGVGYVTKPGLELPVGEPAINPVPRRQIKEAVWEGLREAGLKGDVQVLIEVPQGEKLAKKTLNPRLGIIGGISILGTRGTVIAYSKESYRKTIDAGLDVARAEGLQSIALATGGRSERFLKEFLSGFPDTGFVSIADFFAYSLFKAGEKGFREVYISVFFGKLIKMAQGHPYTHARKGRIDFRQLAGWCAQLGLGENMVEAVKQANTARQVLELLRQEIIFEKILDAVASRAINRARQFSEQKVQNVTFFVFDFQGRVLLKKSARS